jgi:hypothetical protein
MFESFSLWELEDEELRNKIYEWQKRKNKIVEIIYDFLPEDYDKIQLLNIIRKVVENDEDDYEKYLPKEYRKKMKKYLKEIKRGIFF